MGRSAADGRLAALIRDVTDFPRPGVVFADLSALFADASAFAEIVDTLAEPFRGLGVGAVAGVEARGFGLAAPIALTLGAGFVPLRKAGKLPAPTISETYDLEYGTATLEVDQVAFSSGEQVLVVDDVLASGGTALAATELVRRAGGDPVGVAVLVELLALNGRARLAAAGLPVHAVLSR